MTKEKFDRSKEHVDERRSRPDGMHELPGSHTAAVTTPAAAAAAALVDALCGAAQHEADQLQAAVLKGILQRRQLVRGSRRWCRAGRYVCATTTAKNIVRESAEAPENVRDLGRLEGGGRGGGGRR